MRQIYQVTCSQIITSENHPEGLLSSYPDYPKNFDSRSQKATADNPNGSDELALLAAPWPRFSGR